MLIALLVSSVLLWLALLFVAFVVLGSLRSMEVLRWRMEQLEATMPSRLGRSGLKAGKKAPAFTLKSVVGPEVALADYGARKVLLVFVQTGCGPCKTIVPDLNRVHHEGKVQVLAIHNADLEAARKWTSANEAEFPVLMQEKWSVSKRYEVMATPFAFLIDEKGIVTSKGTVGSKKHIRFVLEGRRDSEKFDHADAEAPESDGKSPMVSHLNPLQRRSNVFNKIGRLAEKTANGISRRSFLTKFGLAALGVTAMVSSSFGKGRPWCVYHGGCCTGPFSKYLNTKNGHCYPDSQCSQAWTGCAASASCNGGGYCKDGVVYSDVECTILC
jgi:methylamine dehydrogenase accessory protein MauD